ncbi:MAG: glycosyltransferase [Acidobacteriota bacterium]
MPANLDGLRVAFLAGTLGQGGAERQLIHMLKALRPQGTQLTVLSLTRGEHWEDPIRELGIPVIWVGESALPLLRLRRVIAELGRLRPQILQSCHCFTNVYVAAASRAAGVREVGAIRSDTRQTVSGRFATLRLWSLRHLRSIAVNSRAALESAIAFGVRPNRLFHLPNVVDTHQFSPVDRAVDHAGLIRLLAVGRLSAEKRFDRLLRVVAALPPAVRGRIRVTVAGDGPLRAVLEQQSEECGLRSTVCFAGAQADMAELYRGADLLLLTSDSEGSPNVVLEAMASGLPVVGTRTGGVAELVDHGVTGLLASPDDEVGLAVALEALVQDEGLRRRMGGRGRDRAVRQYSCASLPRALGNLYGMALK